MPLHWLMVYLVGRGLSTRLVRPDKVAVFFLFFSLLLPLPLLLLVMLVVVLPLLSIIFVFIILYWLLRFL